MTGRPADRDWRALLALENLKRLVGPAILTQIAGVGLALLAQIIVARALGADEFGIYSLLMAMASCAAILARGGWDSTVMRFGGPAYTSLRYAELAELRRASDRAVFGAAIAAAVVFAIVAVVIFEWRSAPIPGAAIVSASVLAMFLAFTGLRQSALLAIGRAWSAFAPEYLLRPALVLCGALALDWIAGSRAWHGLAIAAGGSVIAFLVGSLLLKLALPRVAGRSDFVRQRATWADNSRAQLLFNGAYQLLAYADIVVAGFLISNEDLGYYAAARTLASFGTFVLIAMQSAVGPELASHFCKWDATKAANISRDIAILSTAFAGIFSGLLLAFGPVVLGAYGAGFQQALPWVAVLLIAQIVNSAAGPLGAVTAMAGLQREAARLYVVAFGVLVAVAGFSSSTMGSLGIALGVLASTLTWTVGINRLISGRLGFTTWAWANVRGLR